MHLHHIFFSFRKFIPYSSHVLLTSVGFILPCGCVNCAIEGFISFNIYQFDLLLNSSEVFCSYDSRKMLQDIPNPYKCLLLKYHCKNNKQCVHIRLPEACFIYYDYYD